MVRGVILAAVFACTSAPVLAQTSSGGPTLSYLDASYAVATDMLDPAIGEERTVSAGERMIISGRKRRSEGAALDAPVQTLPKMGGGTLPAGTLLYRVGTTAKYKACTILLMKDTWNACLVDDNGDGKFDRISSSSLGSAKPLAAPAAYHSEQVDLPPVNAGFERQLLYEGYQGGVLKIGYREFSENMARDAFTE